MTDANTAAVSGFSSILPEHVQRGNIWRLSIAQALAGANSVAVYATGAIVGNMLAPTPMLATLPISIFVVGMAACILPAGKIAQHHGRRAAFLAGTGAGVLTGLLATLAVIMGWFWLFCLATFFGGGYAAVVLSFRFAAADGVAPKRRARALSLVMAGGRPLTAIARQPRFVAAVIAGAVSYMLMNFLMTAAPLAMHMCGHSQESANLGLQWHVIAMYAPSFFTGALISRFGAGRVATVGLLLTGLSAAVGLGGIDVMHFWWTLILLGVGWNFGFLGASALVLECHRPEEKTRVQSLNDFIVFGLMAVGSFSSGGLLSAYGWNTVLWVSFAPLALSVVALALAMKRQAPARAD